MDANTAHAPTNGQCARRALVYMLSLVTFGIGILYALFDAEGRTAHDILSRAQLIFTRLKDPGNLAQVDETRARVLIAEKKYQEAGRIIAGVVKVFDRSGELALLADALTVQGVAWARLGNFESSINILRQAMKVAQECGAPVNAGQAALTLIEEHGAIRLHETELYNLYFRADALLKSTQDVEDVARLRACALVVVKRLFGLRLRDKNFTLQGAVREFEARFIEQALEDAEGSVTRAAELLGMKYQTLANLLKSRHKRLQKKRTPAKQRKRSIIKDTE